MCYERNVCIVQQLLDDYPKCFIVGADNVGSKQMQQIRMSLRGVAVVLMGKNTMMRKAIRGHLERNPALEKWVCNGFIGNLYFQNIHLKWICLNDSISYFNLSLFLDCVVDIKRIGIVYYS